jgi:hypothetical protein
MNQRKMMKVYLTQLQLFGPTFTGPFFCKISPAFKLQNRRIGVNGIGESAKKIAQLLNKHDHEDYTSHAFRRSGATFLADSGASLLALKQAGGWRSDTVAQRYVQKSASMQRTIAEALQVSSTGLSTSTIDRELVESTQQLQALIENLTIAPSNCSHFSIYIYGAFPSSFVTATSSATTRQREFEEQVHATKRVRTEGQEAHIAAADDEDEDA